MKKFIVLGIVLILLLGVFGCSDSGGGGDIAYIVDYGAYPGYGVPPPITSAKVGDQLAVWVTTNVYDYYKVEFYLDGTWVATLTTSTQYYTATTPGKLYAKEYNYNGNTFNTKTITITL